MDDTIRLKNAVKAADGLEPGEYALDEVGGMLILDRGAAFDFDVIPLDVIALPKVSAEPKADEIVAYRPSGPVETVLTLGAGGPPRDARDWRTPGCTPVGITTQVASLRLQSTIEITSPAAINGLRLSPTAVDCQMTFGVESTTGDTIFEVQDNAYAGVLETFVNIALAPGRYILFVEVEFPISFDVVTATRPFAAGVQNHPVLVRFA
ncbi:hypothetical protein BAJUN_02350 [Bajunvirus bajun]|uniref:Uncharacterized protein n=1 Tax=Brevundimonas phage vB_BgoS-Bajun TaxID=2948594 RepID=A0A9E7N6B0_9CAUD|nr:hypothetical protein BAJUN_02350 [Brevundimonas phage vB_BgoS-Bajun]